MHSRDERKEESEVNPFISKTEMRLPKLKQSLGIIKTYDRLYYDNKDFARYGKISALSQHAMQQSEVNLKDIKAINLKPATYSNVKVSTVDMLSNIG